MDNSLEDRKQVVVLASSREEFPMVAEIVLAVRSEVPPD